MSEEEKAFEGGTTSPASVSDFLSLYVRECANYGYRPIKERKGQLARKVKQLLEAGVPGSEIHDAIRVIAEERKSPGALDLVVADLRAPS